MSSLPWSMVTLPHSFRLCAPAILFILSGCVAKKMASLGAAKWGGAITTLEGKQAARGIAIELIATLQAALGDLDKIKRIVKLMVLLNSNRILQSRTWLPTARPTFS
jgi:hypothetical protein